MKVRSTLTAICSLLTLTSASFASPTGEPFYGDAPDEHHPWAVHDQNRPQPKVVTPGTFSSQEQPGKPPSDAVILFDGTNLDKWEADSKEAGPSQWIVKDGAMECVPKSGYIRTKEHFGDCQLHVEWASPTKVENQGQGRGNSGVFLMGMCEIQVLDNYDNPTYADGMASSLYGVNPPMVNALRPPGQWETYDIVFRRPIHKDGKLVDPGYVTVFVNGILTQDHTQLEGPTGHRGRSKVCQFPEKGPLKLQDHGNPVRYRNIWYRPLPARAVEGGTDGVLSPEATMAKRKETAATIRQSAEKLKDPANPLPEMMRLMESLVYEKDEPTLKTVEQMAGQYVESLKKLAADKLTSKKDEVKHVGSAFQYLAKFEAIPATFGPKVEIEKIITEQGWNKKK